jgi:hypothetical protein
MSCTNCLKKRVLKAGKLPGKKIITRKKITGIVINTDENDDWMKSLPGYKDEIAIIESVKKPRKLLGKLTHEQ